MVKKVRRVLQDEKGASSIEYILIAVIIAVAITVAVGKIGPDITAAFESIGDKKSEEVKSSPPSP